MNTRLAFIAAFTLAPISAFAGSMACHTPESGICVETKNPEIPLECDGTQLESCPTDMRVGTCFFGTQDDGVMSRFYPAYPGNPEKDCEDSNGVYKPG